MLKKTILIGVPVIVVIVLVAIFAIDGTANKEDILKTVAVQRGTIVDKALAVGQIEPKHEVAVKSKIGASGTRRGGVDSKPKTTSIGYGTNSRPRRRGKKPLRGQGRP